MACVTDEKQDLPTIRLYRLKDMIDGLVGLILLALST